MNVEANIGSIELVPYNRLFLSPLNVRKDDSDDGIRELAELIDVEGVVQNLVGYKETQGKGRKKLEMTGVVAGGRRFRALGILVENGRKPVDFPVPCLITTPELATAKSLAENSGRKDLHPADQFIAFRDLVKQGRSVEEVAAAFSVTPLVVQRRLRLANVSPDFIDLYRKGAIKLDHLMALAVTDDTERQKAAWLALPELQRTPVALRRVLTESEMALSRPLAHYVGLEAYQAAGGGIRTDLFAENLADGTLLLDPTLIERLAREKLLAEAEVRRPQAGAWIEVSPRLDLADLAKYQHAEYVDRAPTSEESARLEAIRAELDALETRRFDLEGEIDADQDEGDDEDEHVIDDEDTDDDEFDDELEEGHESTEAANASASDSASDAPAIVAELDEVNVRIEALEREEEEINESRQVIDPEQAPFAGTLLSIGPNGEVKAHSGLLKPEDANRLATIDESNAKAERAAKKKISGPGATMLLRLSAHRTQALQATLADDPKVALAALCQRFVSATLLKQVDPIAALNIQVAVAPLHNFADDLQGSPAYAKLQTRRKEWLEKLPSDPGQVLPWLLDQPDSTVAELLAFCGTLSLDAVEGQSGTKYSNDLARAAHLNMADWWAPTAKGYLGKIKKETIVEIVKAAVSPKDAARIEKLKKVDMAQAAEKLLSTAKWVPEYYRDPVAA